MQEHKIKVSSQEAGKRLDLFLLDFSKSRSLGFSRTLIQKLISDGKVKQAGSGPIKANYKIKAGDEFSVQLDEKKKNTLEAEDMPLDIVYQDQDLAVINKPVGLVVHPAPGNYQHTLVNALLKHLKDLSNVNPQRPGIVHRLDKETSGLLVIAKNNFAHLLLAEQFAKHTIKRRYLALVKGRMEFDEDVIELPIGRHPFKRTNMSVEFSKKSRYAKTHYRTLKRGKDFSFLELEPYTGRTHQLRVHLAFIGHPILGDAKYGKNTQFSRLALHAKSIGFTHPRNNKFIEFSSDTPPEFTNYLGQKV